MFDKDKFLAESKCDVCGRQGIVGVASSCLGAISFAFCAECLSQGAEPEFMLGFTWDMTGGNPAEWVRELKTYKDGRYITWDEFKADADANPEKWTMDPPEEPEFSSELEEEAFFGEVYANND